MNLKIICTALTILSLHIETAFASTQYTTHFENPIKDSRIDFESCAVTGALYGILTNKMGDVVCSGTLKTNANKKYYIYKSEDRKTYDYFELIELKQIGAAGDQEGGAIISSVKLRQVKKNLATFDGAHVSTLKISLTWEYSESSVLLQGKLPGSTTVFNAPSFSLSSIDEDLENFSQELSHP